MTPSSADSTIECKDSQPSSTVDCKDTISRSPVVSDPGSASPSVPARTFWSGPSCITCTQGVETVGDPGEHSSARLEASSLDTLQEKYPEADFSVFRDNASGVKSVTVGGRTGRRVFSVPDTHAVVLGDHGSLSFLELES